MRILFLSDNFPPEVNAPASRLSEHAKYWLQEGHDVQVVTGAPNFPDGVLFKGHKNHWYTRVDYDGVDLVRVKTYITANEGFVKRTLDYMSFMVTGFFAGLVQPKPDVVVATSPQFFCALGGWLLARCKRRPFVFELRDLWPASIEALGAVRYPRILRWLEKLELFLYRQADAVITVTHAFKEDLVARGIDGKKIHVVLNGVDLNQYEVREFKHTQLAQENDLEGKFVVGYVGTHGMAHGLETVLDAAEKLAANDNIRFLLVGAGACKEDLERQISERKLRNVVSLGRFPKDRMNDVWSLCDTALIHLRDLDVFKTVIPSKLFESMGVGLPVMMGVPRGEATGIVEEQKCGVLFHPEDADDMAKQVLALSQDTERYEELKRNSLQAAKRFSRETLANKMAEILGKVGRAQQPATTENPTANTGAVD